MDLTEQEKDLDQSFEFLPQRLYYVALRSKPHKMKRRAFFSVDDELVYRSYFHDFGPLNLGQVVRFCQLVEDLLEDPKLRKKTIYFYSGMDSRKRANAALLICCYALLHLKQTPKEAYRPFEDMYPPLPPFRDASQGPCHFKVTILDCLTGIYKAMNVGFFNVSSFDVDEYEREEDRDLNWIIKDKVLAFAGPFDKEQRFKTHTPEDFIPYFKEKGVTLVIRLNKSTYDETKFTDAGIKHKDLYFRDGSTPPAKILQKYLRICEKNIGAVAVHCKAGLGRTGTLIGAFIMKHYGWTAAETIGWLRICRPGSVIGPQQEYLETVGPSLSAKGDAGISFKDKQEREEKVSFSQGEFLRLIKTTRWKEIDSQFY